MNFFVYQNEQKQQTTERMEKQNKTKQKKDK